ncbi:phosphotransferase [Streptacidiphilus jiangxiensis]|uniref:Phosphotransferase enzyme family protein n=1 Tax=Streptacidiphilus jiangxiensis TaxID=235985 RepID=A0A1H7QPU4_STRJI|nr:phosphotransferase [Streptacidiphilus jiangxiensis]SEL49724.1 Phosphotransferase enzyme family protein [Streptacidiphilus jiangxiensis]
MTTELALTPDRTGAVTWQELLPQGRRYVALPSRGDPVVVALDDRPVLEYLRTSLLTVPPHSRLPGWCVSAACGLLRLPPAWRLTPHLAPPRSGPAPGPDHPDDAAPVPVLRGRDRDRAGQPTPGALGPALADLLAAHDGRILMLRHSHDPDASTLLLLFGAGEATPRLAVKLPARPGAAARVLAEADRLDALAALPLGRLRSTVPEVVELLGHPGQPALVTTAQPGTPMLVDYHRRGHTAHPETVRADLAAAQAWLAAFQSATAGRPAPLDLAPGVLDALAEHDSAHPRLQRLAVLRRRLRRHQARQVAVHGDYWPGNILLRGGTVSGVVDWERSAPTGSPIRDPARLVLGYSQYLDGHTRPGHRIRGHPGLLAGDPAACVAYALDGSGWYPDLVRASLERALTRAGVPAHCARDAVLAETAALAAEATDPTYRAQVLAVFDRLSEAGPGGGVTA